MNKNSGFSRQKALSVLVSAEDFLRSFGNHVRSDFGVEYLATTTLDNGVLLNDHPRVREVPVGVARGWRKGVKPNSIQAMEKFQNTYDFTFPICLESEFMEVLNILAAYVFFSGCINKTNLITTISVPKSVSSLEPDMKSLDHRLGYIPRKYDTKRNCLTPAYPRSLGRVLRQLGLPVGDKNCAGSKFPQYINDAQPGSLLVDDFVQVMVLSKARRVNLDGDVAFDFVYQPSEECAKQVCLDAKRAVEKVFESGLIDCTVYPVDSRSKAGGRLYLPRVWFRDARIVMDHYMDSRINQLLR